MSVTVVEARPEFLRLRSPDGSTADFHYFWLRHNCDCCRHPVTRERTLCSSSIPLDLRPLRVEPGPDALQVIWPEDGGEHASGYSYEWLRANAYSVAADDVAPPANDVAQIEITATTDGRPLHQVCLEIVGRDGAVVVRGAGLDTAALIAEFASGGYSVIGTHFGRIEDLRTDNTTNANTDQLGYTDAAVELHSDQPFLEQPPHYQMLQCMRPADRGGDNTLADALQAARYLRALDTHAFELLTRVPVRFSRQQKQFTRELVAPIVELRDGEPFRVRSSYFSLAPHRMPFGQMEAWYRAYARFVSLVSDPRYQFRVALDAGDFVLYDNFRMLHARTSFTGARWMRGVYFDREETRE